VLELGSGTGLGGLFASALLKKTSPDSDLYMTDICERSLEVVKTNMDLNTSAGTNLLSETNLCYLRWGEHTVNAPDYTFIKEGFPETMES
jgi:16S rRNA G1207 methylase RsmC